MESTMNNELEMINEKEMNEIDGGIFGVSTMALVDGALASAAVGSAIGGPLGFVVGAIAGAGVTYLYDHI